jgi:tetratricopeptide (TPR) repeat protein
MRSKLAISLLLGTLAVTASAQAAPDEKQREQARTHFAAGVNLLQDPARPRYEEAYLEFRKAYSLAGSPTILGNLGLCAMKLERDAEAIDAYSRYLKEVPDLSAEERAQIERDIATLRASVANIEVQSRPSGATIVDQRVPVTGPAITNVYGPLEGSTSIGVRQGHHVLKAKFPDGREATWESDLVGGESHVFEPTETDRPASAAPPRPIPTTAYVTGGIALALGAGALATGLVALDKGSDFDGKNDGRDPAAAEDLRSSGKTLNIVTDGLVLGAIIAAGVTTYLVLTRPAVTKAPTATASSLLFRF